MVEYNKVNVKLSDSQRNKLKSAVKNQTGVTFRMNITMFEGKHLPHELLLTTRQKDKLTNAFENNMPTDIKLFKKQILKIIQSDGSSGALLSNIAGPLMKVAVPLAKNILAPLEKTAAASGFATATLISSNKGIKGIMEIVQALEESRILLTGITKTIENKIKEESGGFLGKELSVLGANLLENMLTAKRILRVGYGNKKGKRILRSDYGSKMNF